MASKATNIYYLPSTEKKSLLPPGLNQNRAENSIQDQESEVLSSGFIIKRAGFCIQSHRSMGHRYSLAEGKGQIAS